MKHLSIIALCVLFAAASADAKTYYVDASRPNNNGNGLSRAKAKKTIQAAINLAKTGDTILVYPGTYAPIKTNNKKIAVKSAKGAAKTIIVKPAKKKAISLAQLGKTWMNSYTDSYGQLVTYSSYPKSKGKNTTLTGFLLDGKNRDNDWQELLGVSGGTAKSCSFQRLGNNCNATAAFNASLAGCSLIGNHAAAAENSVLSRCRILKNQPRPWQDLAYKSQLGNCLIDDNLSGTASHFAESTIVNCTIVKNRTTSPTFSRRSKFFNCILWNNWLGEDGQNVHNTDSGNTYSRTFKDNRDPKFVDEAKGNYKLSNGSPCIDMGTVPAAIKSYVGKVDLAGGKRIKGKAIDMGCYER